MISSTLVANTIQPAYSKKLLDKAVQLTQITQFAQQEELPPNQGNTSVRFYRPEAANLSATGAPAVLSEGVAPTNFRDITYTPVDIPLVQVGQAAKVTDIANNVGLIKYLDGAIDLMGDEFALDVETRTRNPLVHQTTGFTKRYGSGLANFANTAAAAAASALFLPRDLLDSMTQLKLNRAPKFGKEYVAYIPPQITRDVLNSAEWRDVVKTSYAEKLFNGEVGSYFGARIVEHTVPFTEDETEGTFAATFSAAGSNTTGFIYSCLVMGKGAFGTLNMKKLGGSLQKPQIIINDKPDKTDPLNQFITVGWKAYWAAAVLNPAFGMNVRAKSQFA